MTKVIIIKLNPQREEVWRYSGEILKRSGESVLVEAYFNRPDKPFHGIVMREGDRFIEKYYLTRWYNIFEIHDRDDGHIKAWYCNVSEPAQFEENQISYIDLALDLLVFPDGRQLVLDEEEFDRLCISDEVREKATAALEELRNQFSNTAGFNLD
jgi:predicted RNA-binding protein associated with RNAse of E/G family